MTIADYRLVNPPAIETPCLLAFPAIIHRDVDRMAELLGGLGRIRPHIKTHKCKEVVRLLMGRGIDKFKCALVSEAQLLIECGVADIMLAYPLVGPAVWRLTSLLAEHRHANVMVTVDDAGSAAALNEACKRYDRPVDVLIDLDVGMHRTGVAASGATALAEAVRSMSHLRLRGIHAYDGHIRDSDLTARRKAVEAAMSEPLRLKKEWTARGLMDGPLMLSTSGTLSFIIAKDLDGIDEVTPGTWVFWDVTYDEIDGHRFDFAALVASRVVSRPAPDTVTLDAGSKGISRDIAGAPLVVNRPGLVPVRANEEHQVCEWKGDGPAPSIGEVVLFAPRHVCTTIYQYSHLHVVENGQIVDRWPILCRHGDDVG
jgi:D-serine deaminase-like pyridoxal phosphate-dependent protein